MLVQRLYLGKLALISEVKLINFDFNFEIIFRIKYGKFKQINPNLMIFNHQTNTIHHSSSNLTKPFRHFRKSNLQIQYLIPDIAHQYIDHGLFLDAKSYK